MHLSTAVGHPALRAILTNSVSSLAEIEGSLPLHSCRSGILTEGQQWVDSRLLAKYFISVWCRTGIGHKLSFPGELRRAGMQDTTLRSKQKRPRRAESESSC